MHVDYCVTVICVSKKRDKLASTLSLFFAFALTHTHIQTFLARTVGPRAVCSLAIYKKIRFPFARRTRRWRRFCPSSDTLPNITLERQNIVITIDHSVSNPFSQWGAVVAAAVRGCSSLEIQQRASNF
jgi:hypothetical protein